MTQHVPTRKGPLFIRDLPYFKESDLKPETQCGYYIYYQLNQMETTKQKLMNIIIIIPI